MYGCENWTIKKAECRRFDTFELWCWKRLLRVPWISRRLNQSVLKEISPEYSLEVLMLKLQCFGHLMRRTQSLEKTLMLGWLKAVGEGVTEDEMVRWHPWLDGYEFEQVPGIGDGQGSLACCGSWSHKELDLIEQLNWTDVHWVSDAILPSYPLLSLSPPAVSQIIYKLFLTLSET